jgi:predicted glycogen debranching enzyme
MNSSNLTREWLETDGLGGFASGTAAGIRTRRYHALLLTPAIPPTGRMVLVNGFDAWIETPTGRFALTSQLYLPDVVSPDGARRIESFKSEPWPRWSFRFEDGTQIEQEICLGRESQATVLIWRMPGARKGVRLFVRPFLSGRDYHGLHKENPAFRFDAHIEGEQVRWQPYDGVPGVVALSNGDYEHQPTWYRNFRYEQELERGLNFTEDLASPGVFVWDLASAPAVLLFTTAGSETLNRKRDLATVKFAEAIHVNETVRRAEFPTRLHQSADNYIVNGKHGKTILAGYPWFTDWGRDTFIALRGLCIATGRFDDARDILLAWAGTVSEGMLPNRFPDHGEQPEFNSVDASLWYVIAVHDLLQAASSRTVVSARDKRTLQGAVEEILEGYAKGTRFGIRMDNDGLLAAGMPGVQLTWMDAKIGEWVVTPRIGKPVEIQALWLNALKIAGAFSKGWDQHFQRGLKSFRERFWNEAGGCLFDVADADHQPGRNDATFRPNQIFAVGGLPLALLEGQQAERIIAQVEEKLLTPLGLRSLAPGEPGYVPYYKGGVRARDGAYHQGTVWPWLIGPFVEAWLRVHGDSAAARTEARTRFLTPLMEHLNEAGLGHVSEIADAESPHTPQGCPFQAWSVGELLRLDRVVLAGAKTTHRRGREVPAV